jgi:hypothetical protein
MPGPNLGSIGSDSCTDSADENLFGGIRNVIYEATAFHPNLGVRAHWE